MASGCETLSRMSTALRGRGERVASGVWRLRLPLPWPGIPHVNAWALERSDGVVLVDCGLDGPEALPELERALGALDAAIEDVCLLVCTHAHPDHYGLAARVVERARCELWMHPRHAHVTAALIDPEGATRLRRAAARRSGVPQDHLPSGQSFEAMGFAAAALPNRELVDGVEVQSTSGAWHVVETPGHAPSHVCLFQPAAQLLISGDHLLERAGALHFDYGFSPDPIGEYLASLALAEECAAETCLPGHGAPFGDIPGVLAATRAEVTRRLDDVEAHVGDWVTGFEIAFQRHGARLHGPNGPHYLAETLALLAHLEHEERLERARADGVERWRIRSTN